MKFTNAEINQLEAYIEAREVEGWYYAPKEHFEKRHESIKRKLKEMREHLNK